MRRLRGFSNEINRGSRPATSPMRLPSLVAALIVAMLVGLCTAPVASATAAVSLPADESPHRASSMEWWYFTGHLVGTDIFGVQHRYGFEVTMIRTNVLGVEPVAAVYNGQFAVTDLNRGTFKSNETAYAVQPDNVPTAGGFDNTVGGWHMKGSNGQNQVQASFLDGSYSVNLNLNQSQPATLHGDGGLIPYGVFGTSYYYSETNLQASGWVIDHGLPVKVTGLAWQDHQWGNFASGPGGWTWFSIQLKNGTQYMLYFLHDANGQLVQTVGTQVKPGGHTVNLDSSQIGQTPLGSWTSPSTGITYPQNWMVTVPGGSLQVSALEPNQELTTPFLTTADYWEGDCTVKGTVDGAAVSGDAYTEITPHISMPAPGNPLSLVG